MTPFFSTAGMSGYFFCIDNSDIHVSSAHIYRPWRWSVPKPSVLACNRGGAGFFFMLPTTISHLFIAIISLLSPAVTSVRVKFYFTVIVFLFRHAVASSRLRTTLCGECCLLKIKKKPHIHTADVKNRPFSNPVFSWPTGPSLPRGGVLWPRSLPASLRGVWC